MLPQPAIPLPLAILNPMPVKGKGRPKGALGNITSIASSRPTNTRQDPSAWELPSSSAPAILQGPRASAFQPFVVPSGLSSTAIAIARLASGHQDLYEPGTRRERAYMQGKESV